MSKLIDRFGQEVQLAQAQHDDHSRELTFEEYLDLIQRNPKVTRTAFQRVYDMIILEGKEEYTEYKRKIVRYKFFEDLHSNGQDAVFGIDIRLSDLVEALESAAKRYGPERRILLLHGPVGSSKSTIARLLKKRLEAYSRTPEGALYSFRWVPNESGSADTKIPLTEIMRCPMNEEPLHLIPREYREKFIAEINAKINGNPIFVEGSLCPACRQNFRELLRSYDGDWTKVITNHIKVYRLIISEEDRVGIGTFQPKDEKNQDSTELTGDINYRKIAQYGSDSDPRAFNFDGEFNVANRGIIEFVEVLKLDVAFLYDLLGASQEHKIKPKKFPQTDIDEVIIGHTNEPEFRKLESNEYMEALRDRTIRIDVPYVTKLAEEIRIYEKDYNPQKIKGKHIAPHTLEVAAMWAILTRLEDPKKAKLTLLQKLKLYSGKTIPGFTEDTVKELRSESAREGMIGISPRYVQDKISNALVMNETDSGLPAEKEGAEGAKEKIVNTQSCINPFMVLNELADGLKRHSLIRGEDDRNRYHGLIEAVKQEYEDIVKNEVQRAMSSDEQALQRLASNYLDNVRAYTVKEKVKNKFTGQKEEPDERLMRSIELKIDIPDGRKDDFRREIMNYIGAQAIEGKAFDYRKNERLVKALELKLFEDQKDTIKITNLVSGIMDKETQAKIDVVKQRMIDHFGYCDVCATDVLNFVASIFARGTTKQS
ncbi:MAG: serine protein kinase [bacterium]|nr:serine protein kinase [bacterium]